MLVETVFSADWGSHVEVALSNEATGKLEVH